MIYTVFPHDKNSLPQDFQTYADAQEYGNEAFGPNQYEIEATSGECL